jgi:hypothetical protein
MPTRIEVANLYETTTVAVLRRCFEPYGDVLEIELLGAGQAVVVMRTRVAARAATARLNGFVLERRALRVTEMDESQKGDREPRAALRLMRTLRGRCNIAYEIDHAGTPIDVRMFPTDDGTGEPKWKIEMNARDAAVIVGTGATRVAALDDAAREWCTRAGALDLPTLDWSSLRRLLAGMRAL